jgi:hypothetical protein
MEQRSNCKQEPLVKIIRVFNGEYLMGFIPFEVISREKKLKLKICGPLRHCEKIEFQGIPVRAKM